MVAEARGQFEVGAIKQFRRHLARNDPGRLGVEFGLGRWGATRMECAATWRDNMGRKKRRNAGRGPHSWIAACRANSILTRVTGELLRRGALVGRLDRVLSRSILVRPHQCPGKHTFLPGVRILFYLPKHCIFLSLYKPMTDINPCAACSGCHFA